MDASFLDDLDLPLGNHNEDLETISENRLRPLFDTSSFLFCTQDRRDKGIDISYEIKRSGKHTGFRLVIQLKATESTSPNVDGSFSLQLATSNINYLLNQNAPAFYVFYIVTEDTFYYQPIGEVLKLLQDKDEKWGEQKSHIIRFQNKLDKDGFELMYQSALHYGLLQRTLKERTAFISASLNIHERISIDTDLSVTDDATIRGQIESFGIPLINDGRWKDVIELHKKSTGQLVKTALFNLTMGMANYYGGSRLDALSFFKAAQMSAKELTQPLQDYLRYFDATIRFSMGIMTEKEFEKITSSLEQSELIGQYIKLDQIRQKYMGSFDAPSGEDFETYQREITQIIKNPEAEVNLKLTAKCELLLFEGYINNSNYLSDVALINGKDEMFGPDVNERGILANKFIAANKTWSKSAEEIILESRAINNSFIYYTALLNFVKVSYQFDVFSKYFYIVMDIPGYPREEKPESSEKYEIWLDRITLAAEFFNKIGHIENTIVASSAKYELLHYLDKIEKAGILINEISSSLANYEIQPHQQKLAMLKNGGTTHEKFKNWVDGLGLTKSAKEEEFQRLRKEMIEMDEAERGATGGTEGPFFYIQLFPIGNFCFPANKGKIVYEILGIDQTTQVGFDRIFGTSIAIANIFRHPVDEEGLQECFAAYLGIESWNNIHRIRKAFFENGFKRFEN